MRMNLRKLFRVRCILPLGAVALVLVLLLMAILARSPQQVSTGRTALAPEGLDASETQSPERVDDPASAPIDLPVPPDSEALGRWFADAGPKRLVRTCVRAWRL